MSLQPLIFQFFKVKLFDLTEFIVIIEISKVYEIILKDIRLSQPEIETSNHFFYLENFQTTFYIDCFELLIISMGGEIIAMLKYILRLMFITDWFSTILNLASLGHKVKQ